MTPELSEVTMEHTPHVCVVFSGYANLFPWVEGKALDELKADIEAHGVREPIVFLGEQILDGRNRYMIARELGIQYPFCEYIGDDPAAFVLSRNLHRRHLTESQRAMVAAKLANMRQGARTDLDPSAHAREVSQDRAAQMLSVSVRAVQAAKAVERDAIPEIVEAVESGKVAVTAAAAVATLPVEQQAEIIRSADPKAFAKVAKEVRAKVQGEKKAKRAEKEVALAVKQKALPDAKFGVIYADPPWRYETYSAETGMDRSAENHYPTTSIDEICALPVSGISADDCVLFLWATAPMLREALQVMAAWGFEYKSQYIWNKDVAGTGYWNRNKHEILLIGTRGNIPAPAMGTQYPSVIDAPVGRHSAKPEIFAGMIEAYFPNIPKVELNRRGPARSGWAAWGLEAEQEAA